MGVGVVVFEGGGSSRERRPFTRSSRVSIVLSCCWLANEGLEVDSLTSNGEVEPALASSAGTLNSTDETARRCCAVPSIEGPLDDGRLRVLERK